MIRIVRQKRIRATRERWLLWGVVTIVTHPLPHWRASPDWVRAPAARSEAAVAGAADPGATTRRQLARSAPRER